MPAALLVAALLAPLPAGQASAQERAPSRSSALGAASLPNPAPRLDVPGMVIGAPASEASLGITLGRDAATPVNSYIRIRGLGPQLTLSQGHMIAPGAWAVPLSTLPNLRVVIPAGASGRVDVSIALVAIDGGVVAEAKTMLVVAPAALPPSVPAPRPAEAKPPARAAQAEPPALQVPPVAPRSPAPAIAASPLANAPAVPPAPAMPRVDAPQAPPMSPDVRERTEGFLARGRKLLEEGNIASARLFFRRAADEGLADGALALGSTFDPAELDRLHAIGIHPDAAEARHWYERARELGAGTGADRRLERLGRR